MSFFSSLTKSLPTGSGSQAPLPTLRDDVYKAIAATESWLSTPGACGDGISYRQVFTVIQPHFPDLKAPLPSEEIPFIAGWVTNLVFEFGKVDGMAGVMLVQTWVDSIGKAYGGIQSWGQPADARRIGAAIVQGIQTTADPTRVTRDLASRVQTIGSLKKVAALVYGDGSAEARQADAYWSSKMMM